MNEWKEGIWIAVSTLLVSVFFVFLYGMQMAVAESARMEQANINNVEVMKEYYKIGRYDDTVVNQWDVVNCIYDYKGKIDIYATHATSGVFPDNYSPITYNCKWDDNPSGIGYIISNDYDEADINVALPFTAKYRAFVIRNANGEVSRIEFRRIS